MRSDHRPDESWDLRVACALMSLDMVEPFRAELGFSRDIGATARQAARKYLLDWRLREQRGPDDSGTGSQLDPGAWLASVRATAGSNVADQIAQLSDELAAPGPNHLPWIDLMVKLEHHAANQSVPRLTQGKLTWLRKAARLYLAESDHLHARVDALASAKLSPWDAQLLSEDFYPAVSEEDDYVHFDPGAWLWAWLDKRHWQQFRDLLRVGLSAQETDELVSWGNGVIDSRWSLSLAL